MTLQFEILQPGKEEAHLVMEWRNDPETRANSFHTQVKEWDPFWKEFLEEYFAFPALPPLFILHQGKRVGFLRFRPVEHPKGDLARRACDISIQIAPTERQQGLGVQALKDIQPWLEKRGYDDVVAEIKVENIKSQGAFEKAGFRLLAKTEKEVEGVSIPFLRYILALTPTQKKAIFIIAEAGSNWRAGSPEKDLEQAYALIDAAADAGADAVKFQTFTAEGTYVPNAGPSDYLSHAGIRQEITEIFKEITLPHAMLPKLAEKCRARGIEFMSSTFSADDFAAVDPYVKRHKMGSYEIGHLRLLELTGRSGKPLILSTGGATEEEIAWAVDTFFKNGGKDLTLMQCTARYPAPLSSLHLRAIEWLERRFKLPIGFSDHSREPWVAPVAATALGAVMIEKHFTLDNRLKGPDHAFAILPGELKALVQAVRQAEKTLGSFVKCIDPEELELRSYAHRGIQAIRPIQKGELFREGENVAILRPGKQLKGVHPKYIDALQGKPAKRSIPLGDGLQEGDW